LERFAQWRARAHAQSLAWGPLGARAACPCHGSGVGRALRAGSSTPPCAARTECSSMPRGAHYFENRSGTVYGIIFRFYPGGTRSVAATWKITNRSLSGSCQAKTFRFPVHRRGRGRPPGGPIQSIQTNVRPARRSGPTGLPIKREVSRLTTPW
jgi:hypothetical protein